MNNFHGRKTLKLISEIFTISDEVLGLILLENEFHVWQKQSKPKGEQNEENLKRKYVNCKSGKKNSWASEGKYRFYNFCVKIEELRNNNIYGNQVDENMKNYFIQQDCLKNLKINKKVRFIILSYDFVSIFLTLFPFYYQAKENSKNDNEDENDEQYHFLEGDIADIITASEHI